MPTIDADGHIVERNADIRKYLPEPHSKRSTFLPSDGLDTSLGGQVGGRELVDLPTRLSDMDKEGIDISVLFPTSSFAVNGYQRQITQIKPALDVARTDGGRIFRREFFNVQRKHVRQRMLS